YHNSMFSAIAGCPYQIRCVSLTAPDACAYNSAFVRYQLPMLIRLRDIQLTYGHQPLLDHSDISLSAGERVALTGRNGSGKSTLMRIISGEIEADRMQSETKPDVRIARLQQDVPAALSGPVYDVVAAGLGEAGAAVARFHELT